MESRTLNISWPEHQKNVLEIFHNLYKNSKLVDVTLSCLEGSVRAHKTILSTCSPFFQRIFEENPCKHPVLILRGTSLKDLKQVLDFMYTGFVRVQEHEIQTVLKTAEDLEISGLKDCIESKYKTNSKDKKKNKRNSDANFDESTPQKLNKPSFQNNDWENKTSQSTTVNILPEDNTPSHGRDTRFKGKKRVEVHHDRIRPFKTATSVKAKFTSTPKSNADDNDVTKMVIKNITGADGQVINLESDVTIKQEETFVDKTIETKNARKKEYSEGFLVTDITIPDVQLHEVDEEINCSEEYDDEDISQHVENHLLQVEEYSFKCNRCFKSFRTDNDLHCHKRVHTEKKPFKCDYCDTRITSPNDFESIKEQFNHNLEKLISTKAMNACFLSRDKYLELINRIKEIKGKTHGKSPEDYQKVKKYDVIKIGSDEKLICPPTKHVDNIRYYVIQDELFDILHETHLSCKHGGRNRMSLELTNRYKNITKETIMLYLDLCEICKTKSKGFKVASVTDSSQSMTNLCGRCAESSNYQGWLTQ